MIQGADFVPSEAPFSLQAVDILQDLDIIAHRHSSFSPLFRGNKITELLPL